VSKELLYNRGDRNWRLFQNVVQNLVLTVGGTYEIKTIGQQTKFELTTIPENIPIVENLSDIQDGFAYCPKGDYQAIGDLVIEQEKFLIFINATMAKTHKIALKVSEYMKFANAKKKKLLIAWAIPDYMKDKFSPPTDDKSYCQIIMLIPTNSDNELWKKWTQNNDVEWFEAVEKMKLISSSSSKLY